MPTTFPLMLNLPCPCLDSPLPYDHYKEIGYLGQDETNGRFAQVSVKQCKNCGRYWLHYFVEYEYKPGSGRYFMGLISLDTARILKPAAAIDYLTSVVGFPSLLAHQRPS